MELSINEKKLDIKSDVMMYMIDGANRIITDSLIQKFVNAGTNAGDEFINIAKDYCKIAGAVFHSKGEKEDEVNSYKIIIDILESDTPIIIFNKNYKNIKIVDPKVLEEWRNIIIKTVAGKESVDKMFA